MTPRPSTPALPPAAHRLTLHPRTCSHQAHGALSTTYLELLARYGRAVWLGLTATPTRLNPGEQLSRLFPVRAPIRSQRPPPRSRW